MLIKLILNDADFEKSLKRRKLAAVALLLVGLVGLGCYFLLVEGSPLPDFAQGFYLGAASGICLGSVILLVRSQYLLTHPEAQKRPAFRRPTSASAPSSTPPSSGRAVSPSSPRPPSCSSSCP